MIQNVNQISIQNILDKLCFLYKDLGNGTIGIIDDGKITNGRRVNLRENYVTDFSGKGRPTGSPFAFVKKHLNLSAHETFKRFEINFYIKNEVKRPKNKGSPKQKKSKVMRPYSRNRLNE